VLTVQRHRQVVAAIRDRDGVLARQLTEAQIAARTLGMIEIHVTETSLAAGVDGAADPPPDLPQEGAR
jgi:hypothetical protein